MKFTLPADPDEIVERLARVCDLTPCERIYKTIAGSAAGKVFDSQDTELIRVFCSAIFISAERGEQPTRILFVRFIPQWIEALVDDKEAAAELKESYERLWTQTSS